jgi:glycosyltransferase involved in cell wall biosynthesis
MANVDAELWVVGQRLPSDHGEDMEPYFERANLGPRLRRLGMRDDVPDILAASDIFTLPSHFEGLPMSIIEAMLTGLPVVSTNIRGPREQIIDGVTGYLVPPQTVQPLAEALQRLATDKPLRTSLGEAGQKRALAEFDEAAVLARTLDLLGA